MTTPNHDYDDIHAGLSALNRHVANVRSTREMDRENIELSLTIDRVRFSQRIIDHADLADFLRLVLTRVENNGNIGADKLDCCELFERSDYLGKGDE